jgi:hypothetical protein
MAPGVDTNGVATGSLLDIGFSFVEIGSISPKRQIENKTDDKEVDSISVNANSPNAGMRKILRNLCAYNNSRSFHRYGYVGVNICANMASTGDMAVNDYVKVIKYLGCDADYLVLNMNELLVYTDVPLGSTGGKAKDAGKERRELLCNALMSAKDARDSVIQKRERVKEVHNYCILLSS